MSRDINLLEKTFREDVVAIINTCKKLGIIMRPYFTLRDPYEQAKLWRQSRSTSEIEDKIDELSVEGAKYLAEVIKTVGPKYGSLVTNAIPGLSWHQWEEAVDCFWLRDERAEWSTLKKIRLRDGRIMNGYRIYGEEAIKSGLTSGGFWNGLKDWPHIQKRPQGVLTYYNLIQVDEEMKRRFSNR